MLMEKEICLVRGRGGGGRAEKWVDGVIRTGTDYTRMTPPTHVGCRRHLQPMWDRTVSLARMVPREAV